MEVAEMLQSAIFYQLVIKPPVKKKHMYVKIGKNHGSVDPHIDPQWPNGSVNPHVQVVGQN